MKTSGYQHHFRIKHILCPAAIILILALCFIIIRRPDIRYVVSDAFSAIGQKNTKPSEMDASELSLTYTDLTELKKDPRVHFDQSMMLINMNHPLSEDFSPELQTINGKVSDAVANACCGAAYRAMSDSVTQKFSVPLYIMSGYRTVEEQAEEIKKNPDAAAQLAQSEHQAGLAFDVYVPRYAGRSFLKTEAGQYVNSFCDEYGFIIRYPYYGSSETGISYEPWHLRYTGEPHAKIITQNRMTLESYFDYLEPGRFYRYEQYLLARLSPEDMNIPDDYISLIISPDNCGYFFCTFTME